MKKRVGVLYALSFALLLIIAVGTVSFVAAVDNSTLPAANLTGLDKSDSCLRSQIDSKGYANMNVEELAFSLLALGYDAGRQSALKSELDSRKDANNACWPSGSCNLKQTALVLLAYDYINADTSAIKNWLSNQTMAPNELVWYLQIENPSNEQAVCTITYDGSSYSVTVKADKSISGNAGTCLTPAHNNNWLEVKNSCYGKDFAISCDKDFLVSTPFSRVTDTNKVFVPSLTDSGSPNTKVTERIDSVCLKQGSSCNYEGNLWASIALDKLDATFKDKELPYLMALEPDSSNGVYLPSAFLYSLVTNSDEYFIELTGLQKTDGYWQTTSDASRRYYDTAVALLALYGKAQGQAEEALTYLLQPNVQGEGCWGNNLEYTAFILYSVNSKAATSTSGLAPRTLCTNVDNHPEYSCISTTQCDDINGTVLPNFYCVGTGACCSKTPATESCATKGGIVCSSSEDCDSGGFSPAADTSYCCVGGSCQAQSNQQQSTVSACENANYACKSQCASNEEVQPYSCGDVSSVCCSAKPAPNYWWIWLLIILVILLVLAVIYRNQVKIWWFKITSKFKKTPVGSQTRPMMPPQQGQPMFGTQRRFVPGMQRPMPPRPLPPGARPPFPPARRPPFPKEKELDETLKKLKDMSK